jgi:hypothetical protein
VLDNVWYYLATDGTLHLSPAALEKAGKTLDEPVRGNVLEIVTAPIRAVTDDVGRADGDHVLARIEEAVGRLQQVQDWQSIESIFPEERFEYSDEARGARVHQGSRRSAVRPPPPFHRGCSDHPDARVPERGP